MKKIEWFAILQFGDIDLLISQKDVAEGGYSGNIQEAFDSAGENGQLFFLDDFVRDRFGFFTDEKIVTALQIKADFPLFLVTSVVPKVESIPLEEFGVLKGAIGKWLLSCGFTAFRFVENRAQYLVDINKITIKWNDEFENKIQYLVDTNKNMEKEYD